jgi:hypothetical protein
VRKKTIEPARANLVRHRERPRTVPAFLLLFAGLLVLPVVSFFLDAPVMAQEEISDEEPTHSSVEEVMTPMDEAFAQKPSVPRFFPWLKERLKNTPAFFRDTKLNLNIRTDVGYEGAILTLAHTSSAWEVDLQNPWSGYSGHTSVQIESFKRAGEKAFMTKAPYDFSRPGLEGVTVYALYAHGWGSIDASTGTFAKDENEFDADIRWPPQWKYAEGLWFRTRYAIPGTMKGTGTVPVPRDSEP